MPGSAGRTWGTGRCTTREGTFKFCDEWPSPPHQLPWHVFFRHPVPLAGKDHARRGPQPLIHRTPVSVKYRLQVHRFPDRSRSMSDASSGQPHASQSAPKTSGVISTDGQPPRAFSPMAPPA